MQTLELVMLTIAGVALIAALPVALYTWLPASMLERAGRYGRFSGLGTRDRMDQTPSGNATVTGFNALVGQSV
jgi:hypothetical protein